MQNIPEKAAAGIDQLFDTPANHKPPTTMLTLHLVWAAICSANTLRLASSSSGAIVSSGAVKDKLHGGHTHRASHRSLAAMAQSLQIVSGG